MSTDHPTDVLPILDDDSRGFDVAMRGYDRVQVDHFLARLDAEVAAAKNERDAALGRSADLAAQLASAQAQIESLRRQLVHATETVTPENVDQRIRQVLEAATRDASAARAAGQADADKMRAGAAEAAAQVRAQAQAEAEQIVTAANERLAEADETYRARLAEAEQRRAEVEAALAASTAQAEAEQRRLSAEAQAERERLNADSAAKRKLAEEDFELVLRKRRSDETTRSQQLLAEAKASAATTIHEAEERASEIVEAASATARNLETYRDQLLEQLQSLHASIATTIADSRASSPQSPLS